MKFLSVALGGLCLLSLTNLAHAGNIAFSSDRDHAGTHEIYVMKDDGASPTRLTFNMGDCRTPAISPDGRKVAFSAATTTFNGYYHVQSFDLFVVNVNGTGLQKLTNTPHHDLHPTWNADGSKIAFSRGTDLFPTGYLPSPITTNGAIYTVSADGANSQLAFQLPDWNNNPVYSPDGTKIAVEGHGRIWVANADGTSARVLVERGATHPYYQYTSPSWNAAGSGLTFGRLGSGTTPDVFSINTDASNLRRVSFYGIDPTLSPDALSLFASSSLNGSSEIYRYRWSAALGAYDTEGGRNLTRNPANDIEASWGIDPLPQNTAPTAADIQADTVENEPIQNTFPAFDADGDVLTYQILTPPIGTLVIEGDSWIYTPTKDFNGADSFTFRANDGKANSNIATVTINVASLNSAPVAQEQIVVTTEDTPVNITLIATDPDGDSLEYSVFQHRDNGTVSGEAPNLVYTPNKDFNGSNELKFLVTDGEYFSEATVQIEVTPINDAPVAQNQDVAVDEGEMTHFYLIAEDVEYNPLEFVVVSPPQHGTLWGEAPNLAYIPNDNFHGADSFTFKAWDGIEYSNVATVRFDVSSINDAPVSNGEEFILSPKQKNLQLSAPGVLANDWDVDGDALSAELVSAPDNATVQLQPNGSLFFKPKNWRSATYTITYLVTDGTSSSDLATITIHVKPKDK